MPGTVRRGQRGRDGACACAAPSAGVVSVPGLSNRKVIDAVGKVPKMVGGCVLLQRTNLDDLPESQIAMFGAGASGGVHTGAGPGALAEVLRSHSVQLGGKTIPALQRIALLFACVLCAIYVD
jgi:hypothetical protein